MIIENNGQIIVDELRPMSEALNKSVVEDDEPILAFSIEHNCFYEVNFLNEGIWIISDSEDMSTFNTEELEGWIPMPIYQPKT